MRTQAWAIVTATAAAAFFAGLTQGQIARLSRRQGAVKDELREEFATAIVQAMHAPDNLRPIRQRRSAS